VPLLLVARTVEEGVMVIAKEGVCGIPIPKEIFITTE
jgi:hypothetical protein